MDALAAGHDATGLHHGQSLRGPVTGGLTSKIHAVVDTMACRSISLLRPDATIIERPWPRSS